MGSSIITNTASMTALTTLRLLDQSLESAQHRISTGKKINEAGDDVAYWSISNSMASDRKAAAVVDQMLGLAKGRVDRAYQVQEAIKGYLDEIKKDVTGMHNAGIQEQKDYVESIKIHLKDIKNALSNADLGGQNLLVQDGTKDIQIPASFRRQGSTIVLDKIDISAKDIQLAGMKDNAVDYTQGILAELLKDDISTTFDFTKKASLQVFADDKSKGTDNGGTGKKDNGDHSNDNSNHTTPAKQEYAISDTVLDSFFSKVQKAIDGNSRVGALLGSVKKEVDSQKEFLHNLLDNLDKSIGILVDADMNAESAKLSALQVQQQLAVQALSIANQSNQHLLTLFRQ